MFCYFVQRFIRNPILTNLETFEIKIFLQNRAAQALYI